ncbi:hypothetical protein B0A55_05237, partial [Friedmanniomyces simplex]
MTERTEDLERQEIDNPEAAAAAPDGPTAGILSMGTTDVSAQSKDAALREKPEESPPARESEQPNIVATEDYS